MPYTATVLKVMIASPGDVAEERQAIREAVYEWNAIHSADRQIVLLPIAWESHAAPEMGDRAQGIINRQLLKDADLLIAAFWTRLGSPTDRAPSGTVEEIEEHLTAEKPAMLYFSDKPVAPASLDPEQYAALKAFKETCRARGLVESYDSIEEFRGKLARQLATTVLNKFADLPSPGQQEPPPADLTAEAKRLLIEAAADDSGTILRIRLRGGLIVQTNGKNLVEGRGAKYDAIWDSALGELVDRIFVAPAGHKGETYRVTRAGHDEAERLKALEGFLS